MPTKVCSSILATATLITITCVPASGQWVNYTPASIPLTADGKPNLSAPAPRTPDGRPDLSGVWRTTPSKYTLNVAADLKPGEIQPWAAEASKRTLENFNKDDPHARCLPPGPKIVFMTLFKIVQTPSVVVLLHEAANSIFRQILTDGRLLPKDPDPSWLGYSVGHWERDTLVVETGGFNDKTSLDTFGHPHSEELRINERFRRHDFGHLEMQITFEDPRAYNRPWTITVGAQLIPNTELLESICNENEQDSQHLVGKTEEEANVKVPVSVLAKYTGTYQISPGRDIVVTMEDDQLMVDYTQGRLGKIPLVARSDTKFMVTLSALGPPTIFEFFGDSLGVATHLVWQTREGQEIKATRTDNTGGRELR
jgi:hypothetical protein